MSPCILEEETEIKKLKILETSEDMMILMGKEWSLKVMKIVGFEGMIHLKKRAKLPTE